MENNQSNSAVEKVETITKKTGKSPVTKKTTEVKVNGKKSGVKTSSSQNGKAKKQTVSEENPVKRTKTTSVTKNGRTRVSSVTEKPSKKAKADKQKMREQIRAEREKKRLETKLERDKLRAEKAEKRLIAKNERKQKAEAARQAVAAERLRKREERIKRRDVIKNESKEDKRLRLADERAEKIKLKREKAEIKARLISQKRENKRILKEQKRAARAEGKREKRVRGVGGWIAAVVSLGCTVLLLGSLLTFNWLYMSSSNEMLDATYRRAYYDLTGCVDNIDVNLSKLAVAEGSYEQQKLLLDVVVESELAENDLQELPLEDSSKFATSKFINQLGDYSKSLALKIADGGKITEEDREILSELYRRNSTLQQTLGKISGEIDQKFSFLTLLKPEEDNAVIKGMDELENISIEYPKMIYDGPFSDGLVARVPKGLVGSEVTREQALDKFNSLFAGYGLREASVVNESNGDIPTYNIECESDLGTVYAQMTKQGGRLIFLNCYEPCEEEKFSLEECREIAESFVKKAGFENMKVVWQGAFGANSQFNFAYDLDGITVYSDLVKVNVCMERGTVSAVEAYTYFLNHVDRPVPKAKLSATEATERISSALSVKKISKAIVPVGSGEKLSYEVMGEVDGSIYYVYVDAGTGKEIEIFKVVDSAEGSQII